MRGSLQVQITCRPDFEKGLWQEPEEPALLCAQYPSSKCCWSDSLPKLRVRVTPWTGYPNFVNSIEWLQANERWAHNLRLESAKEACQSDKAKGWASPEAAHQASPCLLYTKAATLYQSRYTTMVNTGTGRTLICTSDRRNEDTILPPNMECAICSH